MGKAINTMHFPHRRLCKIQATPTLIKWRSMYQSHNKSCCSASVMAGSVVLHSTLATRELSSSCSHPPSSANQRCSNAPAALPSSLSRPSPFTPPPLTDHSAAHRPPLRHSPLLPVVPRHGQPPLVELQLVQLRENSYAVSTPRRAPARPTTREQLPRILPRRAAVAILEVANPSTERRTATYDHLLIERNSYRSPSHSVTYIRHPSSYYSANYACDKHHVVQQRHPQVQQIVIDLLPNP
jgi:hypothetical protein